MPVAVCAVLSSWWWTERPSETCRAFYENKYFEKEVHLVGCTAIYYDAWTYGRQNLGILSCLYKVLFLFFVGFVGDKGWRKQISHSCPEIWSSWICSAEVWSHNKGSWLHPGWRRASQLEHMCQVRVGQGAVIHRLGYLLYWWILQKVRVSLL